MSDPVIQVRDFRKTYGNLVAVEGISFEVERGEIFGLLGPNGAGKTSILECLEGLRIPDSGLLRIMKIDPNRQSGKLRNLIGVQLQTSSLPENIYLDEVMKLFCAYHGVDPRYDLFDRFGLEEKRKTQYHKLSAGQQRRLGLALAVVHHPKVLFLDEPTAGLDVSSRIELHNLMRELQAAGTTIILATHDMAEADELGSRLAILLHGKIVATGTPLALTATGAGLTKISVLTKGSSLSDPELSFPAVSQRVVKEEYVIYFSKDISPTISTILAYLKDKEDTLLDLRVERPSLEDRFLEITNTGGAK